MQPTLVTWSDGLLTVQWHRSRIVREVSLEHARKWLERFGITTKLVVI